MEETEAWGTQGDNPGLLHLVGTWGLGSHFAVHMGEEMASSYSLVTWDSFPLPKYCRLRRGKILIKQFVVFVEPSSSV